MPKPKYYKDLTTQIIKEIALDLGTSFEEVYSIVNTQSKYGAYIFEHSGFETVTFPYLGKFLVNPRRLQIMNQKKAEQNLKINEFIPGRKLSSSSSSGD